MSIHSQVVDRHDAAKEQRGIHVFRARDRFGGDEVYVRAAADPTAQDSSALLDQFTLHRILRHSGVVDAHDLICDNGEVSGFTMPVLPGSALAECDPASPQDLLMILRDIAFATFGLHSIGYIHGDLSPTNVWCLSKGARIQGMLIDLGFTARIGTCLETKVRGTPGYIAPEALVGRPLGVASDVYAFGKLLEFYLSKFRSVPLRDRVAQLALMCIQENQTDRPGDFAHIYFSLIRIGRECFGSQFSHSTHSLPLRLAGIASKAKTLVRELTSGQESGLYLILGENGSGKSELLRYVCHTLQKTGVSTVRVSEIAAVDTVEVLRGLRAKSMSQAPHVAFLDLPLEDPPESNTARALRRLASDLKIKIVAEFHSQQYEDIQLSQHGTRCRPLTFRECMHASSHLLLNPGIIISNTEAAYASTCGNPRLLGQAMTEYFLSGRRNRGEPADFGRHHETLELSTKRGNRSKQAQAGQDSPGVMYAKLHECRVAALASLLKYRQCRTAHTIPSLLLLDRLSEQFGRLGNLARQSRWLHRGVSLSGRLDLGTLAEEEFVALIRMSAHALVPAEAIVRLSTLRDTDGKLPRRVRFLIRSELGRSYLLARNSTDAQPVLREALALSNGHKIAGEYEAMILNRLGTAKMMARENQPAREYFTQSARSAQATGDWETQIRVGNNLGFLALHEAEPTVALQWIRRSRSLAIREHHYSEYLTLLLNQTNCLVDLGRGQAAERTARLARSLGETLSDRMRMAYADNNLGWIMSMRCDGKSAVSAFQEALRIRESIGDLESLAQTHLNVARLYLIGRCYDRAMVSTQAAQALFDAVHDEEGIGDCQRLSAKRFILLGESERAAAALAPFLESGHAAPRKDLTDALLLKMEALLWSDRSEEARKALDTIRAISVTSHVHPLKARQETLAGFLSMQQGDFDSAYKQISAGISMLSESGREDLLLEGLTIMAILADRMNNSSIGLRYLAYVEKTTKRVREEIV